MCHPMFRAALFTMAKTWKQTKCPATDEWKKLRHKQKMVGIVLSHKKEIFDFILKYWHHWAQGHKITICYFQVEHIYSRLPWWLSGKNSLAMQKTQIQFLGREDPLEQEMAAHFSMLAGKSHGQRSRVGYSPWGHKRVGYDLATKQQQIRSKLLQPHVLYV